jgi:hypothetical protein
VAPWGSRHPMYVRGDEHLFASQLPQKKEKNQAERKIKWEMKNPKLPIKT